MDKNEWEELREVFVRNQGSDFCGKVNAYLSHLHWYSDTFEDATGLTLETYRRIIRNELPNPKKDTVMMLCAGFGLDYRMSTDLFQSAGHALSLTNKKDKAFDYVLLMFPGQGLAVYNRELVAQGLKPLQTKDRKPGKIGNVKIS